MLESIQGNTFEYEKLSAEEQQKRGILGRLKGIIADFKNPTRNGRRYGEDLWNRVFDDPITKEKIANRCLFGELEHPTDGRETIDPEKIAVCLAEQPKKDNQGHLIGIFDVLNTACGQILKTLLDYGTTVGVSSRGSGDTYINSQGIEEVDPDSYNFTGFDVVLIPAVKSARMSIVNESIGNKTLKMALAESLDNANLEDRKVMQETLNDLGIELESSQEDVNIDVAVENEEANNNGDSLVDELQNAILENQNLQDKIANLQEKLSVCYAKEFDFEDEIDNYKKQISKLSESIKTIGPLKKRVTVLEEKLNTSKQQIIDSTTDLEHSQDIIAKLNSKIYQLKESIKEKDCTIKSLNENINDLNNQIDITNDKLNTSNKDSNQLIESLKEQLLNANKDLQLKQKQYSNNLEKQNQLVERYKKIAKSSVDKYIESQAIKLGVSSKEIKSRLNESYTFKDIDNVCDEIQDFRLGLNNLPFQTNFKQPKKFKVNESINTTQPLNQDDIIDNTLLDLVNQF